MNYRNLMLKSPLVAVVFGSVAAHAGQGVGNGGNTVVCRDNAGQIQSVELMDLWEGRHDASPDPLGYTLNVSPNSDTVDAQLERAHRKDGVEIAV
jgi:hypothetical protein